MSSSAAAGPQMTFVSKDGISFSVSVKAAGQSRVVRDAVYVVPGGIAGAQFPLPEVHSTTLSRVIRWVEVHREDEINEAEEDAAETLPWSFKLPDWDRQYFACLDIDALNDMTLAANYMEIYLLSQFCYMAFASRLRGKSTEEMRTILGIENDWPAGEEERIRAENAWAIDPEDN